MLESEADGIVDSCHETSPSSMTHWSLPVWVSGPGKVQVWERWELMCWPAQIVGTQDGIHRDNVGNKDNLCLATYFWMHLLLGWRTHSRNGRRACGQGWFWHVVSKDINTLWFQLGERDQLWACPKCRDIWTSTTNSKGASMSSHKWYEKYDYILQTSQHQHGSKWEHPCLKCKPFILWQMCCLDCISLSHALPTEYMCLILVVLLTLLSSKATMFLSSSSGFALAPDNIIWLFWVWGREVADHCISQWSQTKYTCLVCYTQSAWHYLGFLLAVCNMPAQHYHRPCR